MTDDDGRRLRVDGGGAGEHVRDQRLPGNTMKDLGLRGFHPRALTRGENDDVSVHEKRGRIGHPDSSIIVLIEF